MPKAKMSDSDVKRTLMRTSVQERFQTMHFGSVEEIAIWIQLLAGQQAALFQAAAEKQAKAAARKKTTKKTAKKANGIPVE